MARRSGSIKRGLVKLPEGQIHYRTAGDGPPLLLLHLTTLSSDAYSDVMPILATKYRVIAMDRLGHGGSDRAPRTTTIPALAKIVLSFLDALGVECTSILGHHTGACEAVEIAGTHPERVHKLVLHCPDYTEEERVRNRRRSGPPKLKMDGAHVAKLWRQRREWASPATTPAVMHRVAMAAFTSMGNSFRIGRAVWRYPISEHLPLLRAPTLFIACEHDFMAHYVPKHKSLLPRTIPSEIATMKGVGAFASMERPEEYARIVMSFLAKP